MAFSVLHNITFHVETCCSCGVQFAMTDDFHKQRLENRGQNNPFYCPNGHKQWYIGKTEAEELREKNASLQRRIENRDLTIQQEREARARVEHSLRSTKGVVTKIRKRVGNGVCPCCSRTFENLARHMTSKHPTFTAEAAE